MISVIAVISHDFRSVLSDLPSELFLRPGYGWAEFDVTDLRHPPITISYHDFIFRVSAPFASSVALRSALCDAVIVLV